MSNVTKITTSRKMRLPKLEGEIIELFETQRTAERDIGYKLLEIKTGKEWAHNFEFFDAYLEDFHNRTYADGTYISLRYMKQRLASSEFGQSLIDGTAPKKHLKFFQRQSVSAQERMSYIAKDLMNKAATPISEAAAFTIAFREGHFGDPSELSKPDAIVTERDLKDKIRARNKRRRRRDPDSIARDWLYHIDNLNADFDVFEWSDKSFIAAIQDARFRVEARKLHSTLGEILSIKSNRS